MEDLCDKMADLKIDDDFESLMEVDDDVITETETPMEVDDDLTDTELPMEVDDDDMTDTESPMEVDHDDTIYVEVNGIGSLMKLSVVIAVRHHVISGVTAEAAWISVVKLHNTRPVPRHVTEVNTALETVIEDERSAICGIVVWRQEAEESSCDSHAIVTSLGSLRLHNLRQSPARVSQIEPPSKIRKKCRPNGCSMIL